MLGRLILALPALLLWQAQGLLAEEQCGCDAGKPELTTVTWTIVATLEPTITGWGQMLDRICPTPWPRQENGELRQFLGHDDNEHPNGSGSVPQKWSEISSSCDAYGCYIRYTDPFFGPPSRSRPGFPGFPRPPPWIPGHPDSDAATSGELSATETRTATEPLPPTSTNDGNLFTPTGILSGTTSVSSRGEQTFVLTSTGPDGPTTITVISTADTIPTSQGSPLPPVSPATTQLTTFTTTSIGPDGPTTITISTVVIPTSQGSFRPPVSPATTQLTTFTTTSTGPDGPTTITISTVVIPTSQGSFRPPVSSATTEQTTFTTTSVGPDGTTTLTSTSDIVPILSTSTLSQSTLTSQVSPAPTEQTTFTTTIISTDRTTTLTSTSDVIPSLSSSTLTQTTLTSQVSLSSSVSSTVVTSTIVTSETTTATPTPTSVVCPDLASGSFENNDLGAWYISDEVTANSGVVGPEAGETESSFALIPAQGDYAQVYLNQRLDPCSDPPPLVEFRMSFRYKFTGASLGCQISGNVNREPADFFLIEDDGLSPDVWQDYQGPPTPVQLTYDSLFTLKLICDEDTANTPAIKVTGISVYGLP